jgi:hypothetical protein
LKKSKKVPKNAELHADFKSVEKDFKNVTKRLISKTNLMNMSKSGKSAYFYHIFANNVFGNGFELIPFYKKKPNAPNTERKTFFYKHVLEYKFNYATINGLVHPNC